jgi:hypothetical protein
LGHDLELSERIQRTAQQGDDRQSADDKPATCASHSRSSQKKRIGKGGGESKPKGQSMPTDVGLRPASYFAVSLGSLQGKSQIRQKKLLSAEIHLGSLRRMYRFDSKDKHSSAARSPANSAFTCRFATFD